MNRSPSKISRNNKYPKKTMDKIRGNKYEAPKLVDLVDLASEQINYKDFKYLKKYDDNLARRVVSPRIQRKWRSYKKSVVDCENVLNNPRKYIKKIVIDCFIKFVDNAVHFNEIGLDVLINNIELHTNEDRLIEYLERKNLSYSDYYLIPHEERWVLIKRFLRSDKSSIKKDDIIAYINYTLSKYIKKQNVYK